MSGIQLTDRVALVTGGSRGIGREIAVRLARAGANVALVYRKDQGAAEATVEEIAAAGGNARAFQATIGDRDDATRLAAEVRRELGPVSIFVSNAGIASRGRSVVDSQLDEFERLLDVHLLGPTHLCQLLIPEMRAQARGDLIFISSVTTDVMAANHGPYTIAKAGLEALATTLAKEEAVHGIRVNVVAPGLVETDMGNRMVKANDPSLGATAALDDRFPFGRVPDPAAVASMVEFLASDGAAFVTGQRIAVHGGTPDVTDLFEPTGSH